MNRMDRGRVARRALLDSRECVRALDALRKSLPLGDGGPRAPLVGLGIGVWQIRGTIEQIQRAVGLNRKAAKCLDRLGRALRPGETLLGVLQGEE